MNANSENSTLGVIKLGLTLAVYAAVSCTVLAVVNNATFPKIQQNQAEKINAAMKTFFTDDGFTFEETNGFEPKTYGSAKVDKLILAIKDGIPVGGAAQVSGATYDQATILVGMQANGTVQGLKFLKLTDSPGFGLKANDSTFTLPNGKTFYGQFEGKNAKDGFVAGQTFDAISGATITSVGIANLLTAGTAALSAKLSSAEEGGNNE